jgi:hypothetical protein
MKGVKAYFDGPVCLGCSTNAVEMPYCKQARPTENREVPVAQNSKSFGIIPTTFTGRQYFRYARNVNSRYQRTRHAQVIREGVRIPIMKGLAIGRWSE